MFINRVILSIFVFLIYTLFRVDIDFFVTEMNNNSDGFFDDIINLSTYLILFIFGTIISFNKKNPSEIIWLAITLYFILHILRSLYSLEELQDGAHLGAGVVIISLLPFVLLGLKNYRMRTILKYYFVLRDTFCGFNRCEDRHFSFACVYVCDESLAVHY